MDLSDFAIILRLFPLFVFSFGAVYLIKKINFDVKNTNINIDKNSKKKLYNLTNVILMVFCSRIILYVTVWLYKLINGDIKTGFIESFMYLWNMWDSDQYMNIIENGYLTIGQRRHTIAFFPLYPFLSRILYFIIKNAYLSAFIVSTIATVVACWYLFKLVQIETDETYAYRAVKYLLLFPVSFFVGIAFTESVFLATTAYSLYNSRKGNILKACIGGFLAALTRNIGILLVFPIFIEILIKFDIIENVKNKQFKYVINLLFNKVIYIFLIPIGFFVYLFINKYISSDWFKFLEYQKTVWYQGFGRFYDTYKLISYNYLFDDNIKTKISLWFSQFIIITFTLIMFIYGIKKIRSSYMCYWFFAMFINMSASWLLSGHRYMMGIIPLYISIAYFTKNKVIDIIMTILSFGLLIMFSIQFVSRYQIM